MKARIKATGEIVEVELATTYRFNDGSFVEVFRDINADTLCFGRDLDFDIEKHEGWLNIYRGESGFYLRGNPYKSKEEADEVAKANYKTFCTTVKIEWEE